MTPVMPDEVRRVVRGPWAAVLRRKFPVGRPCAVERCSVTAMVTVELHAHGAVQHSLPTCHGHGHLMIDRPEGWEVVARLYYPTVVRYVA